MAPVNLNYEEVTNFTHPTIFGSCCVTGTVRSARRLALAGQLESPAPGILQARRECGPLESTITMQVWTRPKVWTAQVRKRKCCHVGSQRNPSQPHTVEILNYIFKGRKVRESVMKSMNCEVRKLGWQRE